MGQCLNKTKEQCLNKTLEKYVNVTMEKCLRQTLEQCLVDHKALLDLRQRAMPEKPWVIALTRTWSNGEEPNGAVP
jgi:hypothetical protein